ncbi:hypothetical protein NC651_037229 [Populus alba x Populus x berolinensis]|nr:hypothetical protein NC651_037229 [Populus alba x Populus x berolinensis]
MLRLLWPCERKERGGQLDRGVMVAELPDELKTAVKKNYGGPLEGMILANTTSVGMEASKHYSLVFNTIYTPKLASLLREAHGAGSTIV